MAGVAIPAKASLSLCPDSPAKKVLAEPFAPAASEPVDDWLADAWASTGKGGGR